CARDYQLYHCRHNPSSWLSLRIACHLFLSHYSCKYQTGNRLAGLCISLSLQNIRSLFSSVNNCPRKLLIYVFKKYLVARCYLSNFECDLITLGFQRFHSRFAILENMCNLGSSLWEQISCSNPFHI